MERIRKARREDISRIAEILIFAKRTAYRPIFQNDPVSFGQMQVLPLANQYLSGQLSLDETFVWEEEGVVKGLADAGQGELRQLYVDPFFQGQGVGGALLRFAVEQGARRLWVRRPVLSVPWLRFHRRPALGRGHAGICGGNGPATLIVPNFI